MRRMKHLLCAILLTVGLAACASSPEDARQRGDGIASGADRGNWDEGNVQLKNDSNIYYNTPLRGAGRTDAEAQETGGE